MRRRICGILCTFLICCFLVACGYKTNPRPATATIPGEVGQPTAQAYPDRVVLRWEIPTSNTDGSKLTDISGFKVYRAAYKGDEECEHCEENKKMHANIDFQHPINAVISQNEVSYTDKEVNVGNTYVYSISVYNLKGREGPRSQDVTVVLDKVPVAPQGLKVVSISNAVKLEWDFPVEDSGIQGYRIYRGTQDKIDAMKLIGGTRASETTFSDNNIERGKKYYYVVRSFRMNRGVAIESSPSEIISADTGNGAQNPSKEVKIALTGRPPGL